MERYVLKDNQMDEWKEICRAYAKRENANLIFVNETSFGIEKNGQFQHIYIDELEALLKGGTR